jgi:hypothetical protein
MWKSIDDQGTAGCGGRKATVAINTTWFHVKHRRKTDRAWRTRAVTAGAGRDAHVRRVLQYGIHGVHSK